MKIMFRNIKIYYQSKFVDGYKKLLTYEYMYWPNLLPPGEGCDTGDVFGIELRGFLLLDLLPNQD